MLRLLACMSGVATLACAHGPTVEFDPAIDFRAFATWAWLEAEAGHHPPDPVLHARVRDALAHQLGARGLERASDREPDLRVAYRLELTPELVLRTETPAQRHLPSLHDSSPSFEVVASERRLVRYESGALHIEMSDARTGALVWRGGIERRVRGRFADHADDAVACILAGFPRTP